VDPEVKATVRHIDEVSRGWLSAVLGARVRSVRAEPIGTGQTSATYRLAVDADICPSSLVIKFASGDDAACRRVATAHRSEVGFYQELSASLGVRTPSCWYGALDEDGCRFTLVVEDLAPWRPGRQIDGCTQTQAMAAVRYLAALHASRWNDSSLHDMAFLIRLTKERAEFLGDLALAATDAFIVRYGSRLDSADQTTLREVAGKLTEWQLCREEPFALVHGDFRPDNLLFSPDGSEVVAIDWQTLTVTLPARDLSYFIGTALDPVQRRALEQDLVATYHRELADRGVAAYPLERCIEDYRIGQLQGPMITVLGSMTSADDRSPLADEMFLTMAERSCAAIRELNSLGALSV
jgi:Ser/Thr protein kinase RdoA (MazF antagonist)